MAAPFVIAGFFALVAFAAQALQAAIHARGSAPGGGAVGPAVVVQPQVTASVPMTGGTTSTTDLFLFPVWAWLVILGLVIVVLLVALLSRGTDRNIG